MTHRREVKCINKRERGNPHERITHIGGDNWRLSTDEAIAQLRAQADAFFVNVDGHEVDLTIGNHEDRDYLKTRPDGYEPNNLLRLPECGGGGGGEKEHHGKRPVEPPGPPPDVPRRDRHDRPPQPDRGHA